MANPKKKSSIRSLFQELEEIVTEFERGDIDVENGLEKFEHGLQLATQLKKQLSAVETKIETIKKKYDGSIQPQEVQDV